WLQTIVAVEPVQDTRLVDIRVEHHDPQAARTIADRLAQRFVEDQCRQAADADTSGLVYLTAPLAQMRKRFQAASKDADAAALEALESQYAALQAAFRAEQQRAAARLQAEDAVLEARERAAAASRDQNERALGAAERQSERSAAAHTDLKAEQDLYGLLVAKI